MRILFLGDIVGRPGRRAVETALPALRDNFNPDFVIANGENAAAGIGITGELAEGLLKLGIDLITLGNHAFQKKGIGEYLEKEPRIIRPANFPPGTPGRGWTTIEKNGKSLSVANACGRVFMAEYDDPFRTLDRFIEETGETCRLVDFHAEATSEKLAMAYYLDGRVGAVIGTHTHVQTSDERILEAGTAFITDVGMCGPQNSVIGMDPDIVLRRFTTLMPEKFEVAGGPGVICGVVIDIQDSTGHAERIERVCWRDIT